MDPILTVVSGIGVMVGMWVSWIVGWNLSDWTEALFSYRFRTNAEYLQIHKKQESVQYVDKSVIDEFNLIESTFLTRNEIRERALSNEEYLRNIIWKFKSYDNRASLDDQALI